ncbi:MAG: ATP-binding protein [Terriglobales bacterium]|jgi:DNA helicase HerA-like ATPase
MEPETEVKSGGNVGSTAAAVHSVPDAALREMEETIGEVGEWKLPADYEGSIGRTMFDSPTSKDDTVIVLLPNGQLKDMPRQSLVRIKSVRDKRTYLGVVVEGPFAEPDGLRADSPIIVSVTVNQGILMPKYHGRVHVQLMSEQLEDGSFIPPRRRPLPNSPVFVLGPEEAGEVLRVAGDIRLGVAFDQENIDVSIPSGKKSVLPRHLGILGTTGGGKSTTVSGLISQLQKVGTSVVLLDTEGEYAAINEPTADDRMLKALERRGMSPAGVENTHIYHLVGRETANENHPSVTAFRLDFSEMSPYAFNELLEFTSAQETRYFTAYNVCRQLLRQFGVFPTPKNDEDERQALALDELETGYPRMKLSHMIDIAGVFLHEVSQASGDPKVFNDVFKNKLPDVRKRVQLANSDSDVSWRALLAKLWRLHRFKIFDNPAANAINYEEMLQKGRVSMIDLSDMDSPQVRNIVIAQILKGIQRQQDVNYQAAVAAKTNPNPTMVFIEEAHEFLSTERIKQMSTLFQQVARIARRGRKRWLGMVFISQLPQHLPDEVLGLINNWILHKIGDSAVVTRLKKSIGGIDDSLWNRLPNLSPGQAISSFTSLARALQVNIDPTPCRLLMIE